jgi:hypothetical protein
MRRPVHAPDTSSRTLALAPTLALTLTLALPLLKLAQRLR